MTRRRTALFIFGSLTLVFLVASTITVLVVRDRLRTAVDENLENAVEAIAELLNTNDLGNAADLEVSERAVVIIDGRDELVFIPAGSRLDPAPRPDLSASTIASRAGTPFQVSSIDGTLDYRVLTTRLDDGRFLAMAQPLDDVDRALRTLSIALLVTLFAVIVALGTSFWLILRASIRPYDDMIETAEAISDGDIERRITADLDDPNLDRLAASLNNMLNRIESSFADKQAAEDRLRQFVADASHELRNPLTSIRGYSELYLSGAATTNSDVDNQMGRINDEAARLGRLVSDLLTLARLDEQRPTQTGPVDLVELSRTAVDDHLAAHPDANVDLDLATDAPLIVHGDGDALRQVLTNLLANTHHHTPPGTPVHVAVGTDDAATWLRVADEGPGVHPDVASRIFDRFYRADPARTGHPTNSGLGLSIVAAIVAAHHGTIELDTNSGYGTTFTVRIPNRRLTNDPTTDATMRS